MMKLFVATVLLRIFSQSFFISRRNVINFNNKNGCLLTKSEMDQRDKWREELINCESSFNPFVRLKSAGLRERLKQLEQKEKEKKQAEEEFKQAGEKLKQAEEKKILLYDEESNQFYDDFVTRDIFLEWRKNNQVLRKVFRMKESIRVKPVSRFEDIIPEEAYTLKCRRIYGN
jgi:hypothetical protein